MVRDGTLYWITGLSGSGKTTIGNYLYYEIKKERKNVVILDGDILQNVIGGGAAGYTHSDRKTRGMQYARMCKALTDQGIIVICCTVCMYEDIRKWNRRNNSGYIEIFIDTPIDVLKARDQKGLYSSGRKNVVGLDIEAEFPQHPDLVLLNDNSTPVADSVREILDANPVQYIDYRRDASYWNAFYREDKAQNTPSLFAEYVEKLLKPGESILELGCGNGRDTIFFADKGYKVTAIDASDVAIDSLVRKYNAKNIWFICDDFTRSAVVKASQYKYVYSRFTLHAINAVQENEMLHNVFQALKPHGKFFVEARSINDELYGKGRAIEKNAFIYHGHYRRFIDLDDLCRKLRDSGFGIEMAEESNGFAPYGESDPKIIRVIAVKP